MTSAIIVAAGSSRRMGFDKLFADLHGEPVLAWAVRALALCEEVSEIIVVATAGQLQPAEGIARLVAQRKLAAVVTGGAERHLSVLEGLRSVAASSKWVAVHDGARPLVSTGDISKVIARAQQSGAAALAHPVVETLKRADPAQRVIESIDRSNAWAMETPQVFETALLIRACEFALRNSAAPTDEVSAVQALGHEVVLVASTSPNPKITRPEDLTWVQALAART
jgi:2-C-methyl-D-erythritol 4-phosphate cytidylyltransferase